MNDNLKHRYTNAKTWQDKVTIMELYYFFNEKVTVKTTAKFFETSTGLVSENLRIARYSHNDVSVLKCSSREEALKKCERRSKPRPYIEEDD